MPAIHSTTALSGSQILLWRVVESEQFFRQYNIYHSDDLAIVAGFHPERRREWLAGRYLVWRLLDHPVEFTCRTTGSGQPILIGDRRHISISHTHGLVAATVSEYPVGVDIQVHSDKLIRVQAKFANRRELASIETGDHVRRRLACWCGKEAMFKLYAEGGLDFRRHMQVELDNLPKAGGIIRGILRNSRVDRVCDLYLEFVGEIAIVQAMYGT